MTADLVGMMRAVEAMRDPATFGVDWGTVLIAADAAAEAQDFELEAGLRWCVRNKKWPRLVPLNNISKIPHAGYDVDSSWHWDSAQRSGRSNLPQNIDRWLGPGGYHDPDLAELLRRTGRALVALEIVT